MKNEAVVSVRVRMSSPSAELLEFRQKGAGTPDAVLEEGEASFAQAKTKAVDMMPGWCFLGSLRFGSVGAHWSRVDGCAHYLFQFKFERYE